MSNRSILKKVILALSWAGVAVGFYVAFFIVMS